MTKRELLARLERITVSRRDHRAALYKPLFLLALFARVRVKGVQPVSFSEVENVLRKLIMRYSSQDSVDSVGQPWWHLPTDGLWRVMGQQGTVLRESGTPRGDQRVPSLEELRKQYGEFPSAIQELLSLDPDAAFDAIQLLLARYFQSQDPSERTELLNDLNYPEGGTALVSTMQNRIGSPYSNVGHLPSVARRDPFEVDPDVVDRGNRGHALTLDALADFLRSKNIQPLRPDANEPMFDLAWERNGLVFIAEIKSITDANEEKQLRLGLGQVLRYQQALELKGMKVVPVLVPERKPTDPTWIDLCTALGIRLVWPGKFGSI